MTPFAQARRNMVDGQLRTFDVSDRAVLVAMDEMPRERFVPAGRESLAYGDGNIALPGPAGQGRVMLAPMVLARLLQAADIDAGDRVLDVGGATGYTSALLAALGATVTYLESRDDLAAAAEAAWTGLGLSGIEVVRGALSAGAPGKGPFDVIVMNGSVEARPETLLAQLADGGRFVCLWQDHRSCAATLLVRAAEGYGRRMLFDATAPVLDEFALPKTFAF